MPKKAQVRMRVIQGVSTRPPRISKSDRSFAPSGCGTGQACEAAGARPGGDFTGDFTANKR